GQGPVDFATLETVLVRFSQLLADQADISEVDINPLLAGPEGVIALDARVLLTPADHPVDHRLAIRPYPNQYTHSWSLEGQALTIRVIRLEDEPLIQELFSSFSEHTVRMRYFSLVKRLSKESLIRFCHLDYEREMALVALDRHDGKPRILGVSRYY